MGDPRACEQCGAFFEPRREHARFCSARCRAAWNRGKLGDSAPDSSALRWSVAAMNDTADLLAGVGVQDRPKAVAVIGDMVWWVTIVDATLVRHHQEAYDQILDGLPVRRRRRVEGILGGLRFVRNRMREEAGCGHFIGPSPDGERWWWMPVPPPSGDSLAARALEWEMTRYSSYSTHVAGRTTGHVFENALAFLRQAIAESTDESPGLITGATTHGHAKVAHGRARDSNSRILRAGRGTGPAKCRCGRTGVPADDPANP